MEKRRIIDSYVKLDTASMSSANLGPIRIARQSTSTGELVVSTASRNMYSSVPDREEAGT